MKGDVNEMEAEATTGDNNDNSVGVWHRRNHGNEGKRRDVQRKPPTAMCTQTNDDG